MFSKNLNFPKPSKPSRTTGAVLSTFDFWLEIVGLIFSFGGLFFDQSASAITKLARSRVKRKKLKVGLFYLTIIILSLAYCGYLCVRVTLDQQA